MSALKTWWPLRQLTALYLAFPVLLFALAWFQPWFGIPMAMALSWFGRSLWVEPGEREHFHPVIIMGMIAFGLAICGASGIGGLAAQNTDYWKHNAILHDLATMHWPVRYAHCESIPTIKGPGCGMIYYVAFYLPGALLGKIFGSIVISELGVWLYASLGIALVIAWIHVLLRSANALFPTMFFLFSGIDFIGYCCFKFTLPPPGEHLEWWAGLFQYSGMSTTLLWVPQHGIAAWLGAFYFIDGLERRRLEHAPLVLTTAFLWSPFVVLGLLPFFAIAVFSRSYRLRLTDFGVFAAGALAYLPYFAGHGGGIPADIPALHASFWLPYIPFVLFEGGALLLLIARENHRSSLFCMVAGILTFLPLFRMGNANDLVMRVSMPSLAATFILVMRAMQEVSFRRSLRGRCVGVLLAVGAITPLYEWYRAYVNRNERPIRSALTARVVDMGDSLLPQQYVGELNSVFFRYFARTGGNDSPQ